VAFDNPVAWVQVWEAIEQVGFAEPVVHVEGTEVGLFRKGQPPPPHSPFEHALAEGGNDKDTTTRSTQVSRQSPKTPRSEHVLWAGNELS